MAGLNIGPQRGQGGTVLFNKGRMRGTTRQRLQTECASASKRIEHPHVDNRVASGPGRM